MTTITGTSQPHFSSVHHTEPVLEESRLQNDVLDDYVSFNAPERAEAIARAREAIGPASVQGEEGYYLGAFSVLIDSYEEPDTRQPPSSVNPQTEEVLIASAPSSAQQASWPSRGRGIWETVPFGVATQRHPLSMTEMQFQSPPDPALLQPRIQEETREEAVDEGSFERPLTLPERRSPPGDDEAATAPAAGDPPEEDSAETVSEEAGEPRDAEALDDPVNHLQQWGTALLLDLSGNGSLFAPLVFDLDGDGVIGEGADETFGTRTTLSVASTRDPDRWQTTEYERVTGERIQETEVSREGDRGTFQRTRISEVSTFEERHPIMEVIDPATGNVQRTVSGEEMFENLFENGWEALRSVASQVLGHDSIADGSLDLNELVQLERIIGLRVRVQGEDRRPVELGIRQIDFPGPNGPGRATWDSSIRDVGFVSRHGATLFSRIE